MNLSGSDSHGGHFHILHRFLQSLVLDQNPLAELVQPKLGFSML